MTPRTADRPSGRSRRGLSLVEILVALAVASIGIGCIVLNIVSSGRQSARLDAIIAANFLAQSILEQAVHRFDVDDSRFFTLVSTPKELLDGIRGDAWKQPFLALAQDRTPVRTPAGVPNPYFDATFGPPLPSGLSEAEDRHISRFQYQVQVAFTHRTDAGPVELDSDGDGKRDVDLAVITVQVFYNSDDVPAATPLVSLSTYLLVPDKAPGVKALSTL